MKTLTLVSLLLSASTASSLAQAQDKIASLSPTVHLSQQDEIKRGPLADFYELVAQYPQAGKMIAQQDKLDDGKKMLARIEAGSEKKAEKALSATPTQNKANVTPEAATSAN